MLGQRQLERHQHGGPDDRVEAHDVLGDHVDVGGPEFVVIVVAAVQVAQRGDIVGERVDPDIDNVLLVKGDGNAPAERGARNAQILQTGLDEVVHQLGGAGLGLQVVGFGQQLFDALGKGGHFEEVRLLLGFHDLSAALGTFAVNQLAFRPEALAGRAVFALVFALVNIAAVVQLFENLLYAFHMVVVGGADVAVVADVHKAPQALENLGDLVNVFLGSNALFGGFLLNFQTVLVRARQKHDVVSLHTSVARDGVAGYGGVAVPDVRVARGIINRRCDIIRFFLTHILSSLGLFSQNLL